MRLIGFAGLAQSGKDTAAKALGVFGYRRIWFAEPVRKGLYALNPNIDVGKLRGEFSSSIWPLQWAVDHYGWDQVKQLPEVRGLLQRYGTEAGRDIHGQECWIKLADKETQLHLGNGDPGRFAFPDTRFHDELNYVTFHGRGAVFWIDNPNCDRRLAGEVANHRSENTIGPDDCYGIIVNDCDLLTFEQRVRDAMIKAVLDLDWRKEKVDWYGSEAE